MINWWDGGTPAVTSQQSHQAVLWWWDAPMYIGRTTTAHAQRPSTSRKEPYRANRREYHALEPVPRKADEGGAEIILDLVSQAAMVRGI